jgi:hypothetical protein
VEHKRQPQDLKIIVTSTPKTGNNWVKQLLAAAYGLPVYTLTEPFTTAEVDRLGERWVAHQHYFPVMDLLEWAERNGATFVTTTRHPGDALVSLYHHIHNRQQGAADDVGMATIMAQDRKGPGSATAQYVRKEFFYGLNVSIAWMRSGLSLMVRYEDLWRDPVHTLANLTEQILPVNQERIARAVAQCQIGKLRKLHDPKGRFFRKGTIGNWVQELPEEIKELFRTLEPYPSQFAALGYSMNPNDPLMSAPAKAFEFQSPLDNLTHFENGVPIPAIVEKLYLSLDDEYVKRWDPVERTSTPDSFWGWLNAPAEDDPFRDRAMPVITNLAAYIYGIRKDLQLQYPDPYRQNRIGYAHWFAMAARNIYDLDRAYVLPVLLSWSGPGDVLRPESGLDRRAESPVAGQGSPSHRTGATQAGQIQPTTLDYVQATSKVNPHQPIAWPTWPKGLWPKAVALGQKVTRRLLQWYINPIVAQQNRFNKAVVQTLGSLWQQNTQLQQQLAQQEQERAAEEGPAAESS